MARESFIQKHWSSALMILIVLGLIGYVIYGALTDDSPPALYYRTQSLFFTAEHELILGKANGDEEQIQLGLADYYKVLGGAEELDKTYDYAMIDIMRAYGLYALALEEGNLDWVKKARDFGITALEKLANGQDAPLKVRTTNADEILARQKMEREYLARMILAETYWCEHDWHIAGLIASSERDATEEQLEDEDYFDDESRRLAGESIKQFKLATRIFADLTILYQEGEGGSSPLTTASLFGSLNEIYDYKKDLIEPLMQMYASDEDNNVE